MAQPDGAGQDLMSMAFGRQVDHDTTGRIEQRLRRRAATEPDAVAVVGDGVWITYGEFDARVNQLARTLREMGSGPGDLVAIAAERSPEMLVAVYAVLRSGAAYLPIDPSYPRERIAYMLSDARVGLVLARRKWIGNLPPGVRILDIDAEDSYDACADPLRSVGDGHDLAYVIYTSGSTGNPKGVMIEHHSVLNRIDWMQRTYPITADDVILHKTPISFDVSVWELFWWAFAAARVCLLEPGGHREPDALIKAVRRHRVTTMHFVPSLLAAFLDYVEEVDAREDLATLRRVFASGEALGVHHVVTFQRLLSAGLVNLYGPTEATVDVSHYDCTGHDPSRPVPIGRPIDNICMYVVDERCRLLPLGTEGELCLAGTGLARGYLHWPELTQEKFIEHPFPGEERIYRTGDLARMLPDGTVEYLGRLDNQVKIRGFRVELGEIEARLRAYPGVTEAVVTALEGPDGQPYLCGYVVSPRSLDEQDLRRHVAAVLPNFMVPTRFVTLSRLPVSPNGKLDRNALPVPVRPVRGRGHFRAARA
jgi:amino acid adenylation domain-containing protein